MTYNVKLVDSGSRIGFGDEDELFVGLLVDEGDESLVDADGLLVLLFLDGEFDGDLLMGVRLEYCLQLREQNHAVKEQSV